MNKREVLSELKWQQQHRATMNNEQHAEQLNNMDFLLGTMLNDIIAAIEEVPPLPPEGRATPAAGTAGEQA